MMEVTVAKRRRSWEWRVHDDNGTLIMHGRERSRPAARYQRLPDALHDAGGRSQAGTSRGRPSFAQRRKPAPTWQADLARLQRPARPFTRD